MRDPKELLALLTVQVQRLSFAPGGAPAFTPQDLAQGLAYIKDDAGRLLMRVKYGGDTKYLHDLDIKLYIAALQFFYKDRGGLPKGEFIRAMCQMAIAEFMDDHTCQTCQGTSAQIAENLQRVLKDKVCHACNDSGKVYPTDNLRAQIVGVHPRIWANVSSRYRQIQGILWEWEGGAIADLFRALAEENTREETIDI